ncbi:MAG: response regulator [Pseudomonadales bacterium]|nr:response regulator [Pseudomonadales bacterium]
MSQKKNNAKLSTGGSKPVPYFTPADVAKRLLVSPITVNQWAKKGWIKSRLTGGGHLRFLPEDVDEFCRERNIVLPDMVVAETEVAETEVPETDVALRILIVDSDNEHCDLLARFFAKQTMKIESQVATDGFEAGLLVERFEPHIVLLEFSLPGINIYKMCKQLNGGRSGPKMRIIAMSQVVNTTGEKTILEAGVSAIFSKPVNMEALTEFFVAER